VAGKKERQRRLARERHERRMAREVERRQRQRKVTQWASGALVVVVVAAIVGFTLLHLNSHGKKTPAALPTPNPSSSASPSVSPTPTWTPDAAAWTPAKAGAPVHCTYTPGGPPARNAGLPPAATYAGGKYQATIKTNRGTIVVSLLNSKAPCTVNSFAFLATKGYFGNTPCPRLTTTGIYVLQCGDPTGTGSGGPGYQFASENLAGAKYPTGTLAMANSGTPDSNGSQFFLVYKNTPLPASYTPFGKVVSGLGVLQTVAKAGYGPPLNQAGGGQPKESVVIESITIKKT
jgi:peptidyl-prolyl cis-trans isomerase B (cyclophilin B)